MNSVHIISALKSPQTAEDAASQGINAEEWERLISRLGRAPNRVELGIYAVMWSEHCSYKSSRRHLSKLPTSGDCVIQGPGENAGVVDIGDEQAIIFKMESHNHPSFIEPYQGAATGVGGILRDVFTMGARPIALVNALRFGDPEHPKTRKLVAGVVAGIGGYGNCVGVPTVGGETQFDPAYNQNILVNAMAVGLADKEKIFYARGAEPGNPLLYVGAKTGRDGIHGATMASTEFSEGDEDNRPTVQVGDPFKEKLLIEACLELMATDAIQSIQDMGAAGLTSSSVEMADKGGVGIDMDLDRVPVRETGMTAEEIMLSESQERMLMVLKPGKEIIAKEIFEKWDLDAEIIGQTTTTGNLVLRQFGEIVCNIPVAPLAEDAPNYDRPYIKPEPRANIKPFDEPDDYAETLLRLMSSPNMASKRWLWEQYDRHVMADTLASSQTGGNASIVRIHGEQKAIAISSDCNPHYVAADPFLGGMQAVAEAYRNLTAVGADPLAVTNNLNFGNPERPEIMGQFVGAIEGIAKACEMLNFPVVSGNVSLYNETDGKGILPTPVIAGVGLITDLNAIATLSGAQIGDHLVLMGDQGTGHLGASLFAREILGLTGDALGPPPPIDLDLERNTARKVQDLIRRQLVNAVHDVSDGGIACALAEMCLTSDLGAVMGLDNPHSGSEAQTLFGEDQARYLFAASEAQIAGWIDLGLTPSIIGYFGGDHIELILGGGGDWVESLPLDVLRKAHEGWMPDYMEHK